MELLETILHSFVNFAMLLFEYIGVAVIAFAGIQGIVNYIRREPDTRLVLAKGLAMGLEFKLGSEILRTVIVRSLDEIYIVAGIILLRAVLTLLIHWEIKNEENEENLHNKDSKATEQTTASSFVKAVSAAAANVSGTADTVETQTTGGSVSSDTASSAASSHSAASSRRSDEYAPLSQGGGLAPGNSVITGEPLTPENTSAPN